MTYCLHRPVIKRYVRVWIVLGVLTASLAATTLGYVSAAASLPADGPMQSNVYINEVKSGGTNTTVSQYVTVYNTSDSDVPLSSWAIEYAKPTFPPASCAFSNWKLNGNGATATVSLTGTLAAHTVSQPFALAINDNDPGSVHLVDNGGVIRDTVGWGNDILLAPCYESAQAPQLTATKSLQRYLGCVSDLPIDTDDNAADFVISSTPRPGLVGTAAAPQCTPVPVAITPPAITPTTPDTNTIVTCEGALISELMPNPAGTDTGHEFIELYNPTNEVIALGGCSLQTSASTTKLFNLTGSLEPGQYLALYDTTTGLSLPNSAGGTVWLTSPTTDLQTIMYPGDMEDDTAWILNGDDSWVSSFTPTPGASNVDTPFKPCDAGQVRNPDTDRCINEPADSDPSSAISAASGSTSAPTPCKEGQERNPATNRCRNITSITTDSTATCKAGQERNPATNRCRNIVTTASTAKDCPAGQERNADTNRCRKTTAAGSSNGSTLDGVKDVASTSSSKGRPYWLIAVVALAAAIAYGVYEWRQEIVLFIKKQFNWHSKRSPVLHPTSN
jgi:hypothetical protein